MKKFFFKNIKVFLFLFSIIFTILMGSLTGVIFVYQKGFPQIKNLEDIKPPVITTIYDDLNVPIKEFAVEKRSIVMSSDIPDVLRKAIITAEDQQFRSHWGINFKGIFRAILGVIFKRDYGGGSSITMQLARGLFLFNERMERTFSRKLKEILLAIQIERQYSKDQIFTFYCNQMILGPSVYGVEAASKYYFGKSVKDIDLAEAALLAAIYPSPNGKFHVFRKQRNCIRRRNYIIKRMLESGLITKEQYSEAIKRELPEKPYEKEKDIKGDYFCEETRKYIKSKLGVSLLYEGGLKVYTTLNSEMQKWAEESLREGLRELDKRRGWRKSTKVFNVIKEKKDIEEYKLPSWKKVRIKKGEILEGIVLRVNNRRAIIRIDEYQCKLSAKNAKWTKMKLTRLLKKGDVALFRILEIDDLKKTLELSLEQEPDVQGAIIVVENKTGEIKAMVGGYSFFDSEWNRATQAKRQTGSTFKPIIYTAAIENGYTPSTIIKDEPFYHFDKWTEELWEPQNDSGDFKGPMTLRRAFEQSRNVVTARIVEDLTPQKIVQYAKKFGITSELKPYMSIALGSFEVTLKEMVAAYTVFPNYGIRVNPFFVKSITDRNNRIFEENYPDRKQVVEQNTAYVMNYLLQGVVKYGTGWRAKYLKAPIGGKTGTCDDYTDAWFIGFSPSITVGVWVGFDVKKNLGDDETGSRAANPVFVGFMEKYLEKYPEAHQFRKPSGVIMVNVDRYTGKLLTPDCLYPFKEAFLPGTEPLEFCKQEDHLNITDYFDSKGKEGEEEEEDGDTEH